MKVIYAGTPDVAVEPLKFLAAQPDIDIVAVLTRCDAPVGRKKIMTPSPVAQMACQLSVPTIKANRVDTEIIDTIAATGAEIGAIVAYGALLTKQALEALEKGWVNLHFSALPAWRGAAPVQRALLAGETTMAATTFVLDEGMDTGPVVRKFSDSLRSDDVAGTVLERLSHMGAPVLADSLRDIVSGVIPTPQVGHATLAPKLTSADARLDWHQPGQHIAAKVRAVSPEPGAWTELESTRFKILGPVFEHNTDEPLPKLEPGRVSIVNRRVFVGTGTHPLELVRVHPAGKKPMDAIDWARGRLGTDQSQGVTFS